MKILIYGLNYWPELVGVGKYTSEMARWLAARGHQVTVITAPPHYPRWSVGSGYRAMRYVSEEHEGVRVLRCPIWLPKRYSTVKRVISMLAFAASSFVTLLREVWRKPNWVIVIEPSFFCVPGAWLATRLARVPLWLHVQDLEVKAASSLSMVRGGALLKIALAIEAWFMRRPKRISTISEAMQRAVGRIGVPTERTVLFPNWVDCQEIFPLRETSPLRAEVGIALDKIVLLYSGSFGRKHGLELIIAVAKSMAQHPQFQFVLCGEGVERDQLHAKASDLGNILWLPLQPKKRLNDLLNLADIHLLPQRLAIAEAVLPSKLAGMLASGRPVVATAEPAAPLAQIVELAGIVVPPNDHDALVTALIRLGGDREERVRLGQAARHYAETMLGADRILARFERDLVQAQADQAQ